MQLLQRHTCTMYTYESHLIMVLFTVQEVTGLIKEYKFVAWSTPQDIWTRLVATCDCLTNSLILDLKDFEQLG